MNPKVGARIKHFVMFDKLFVIFLSNYLTLSNLERLYQPLHGFR